MDTRKVGMFLAELRKQNKMTQEQLGVKIGVTKKTLANIKFARVPCVLLIISLRTEVHDVQL